MSILNKIEEQLTNAEESRNGLKGRIELLKEQTDNAEDEYLKCIEEYKMIGKVLDILRKYAILKEQILREKIDNIVTKGLRLIFGKDYRSKLEFGISRGQAVIKPRIITMINGEELETDIASAHGGGLVNIVSVLYQILVLSLVRPKQRQVLFLDEPFRNVSEEYLEATGEFLKQLNVKLGIQIILITHRKELLPVADKVYEFSLSNGLTKVKQI